jgi:hypothetical protein
MALNTSPIHHVSYHLVPFGPDGVERIEPSGELASEVLANSAKSGNITDIFIFSHGWNGDLADARGQYGRWLDAMAECRTDIERLKERQEGFRPLLVGLHWPSKPWGDEDLGDASFSTPVANLDVSHDPVHDLVNDYAAVLGEDPAVRDAIARIVDAAARDAFPETLPPSARKAYLDLNNHLAIESDGEGAAPGDDRGPFHPDEIYRAMMQIEDIEPVPFGRFSLAGIMAPLRFLSFWTMKRRALLFGQSGAADLLTQLRSSLDGGRIHLAGHSFGCIVTSAAVAGPPESEYDQARADSLILIQGAMSLWSFCDSIPKQPDRAGYFRRIVGDGLVDGPIVATTSVHDKAVRMLYPLAAGLLDQTSFAPQDLPLYGGIGTFGVQGPGIQTLDNQLHESDFDYAFDKGVTYNLDANNVISQMSGISGAHSDICHPELAHAILRAADSS